MAERVRRANIDDADASSAVLANAFSDSPWTRWTVDAEGHTRRIQALQRLSIEQLALPYGEVWVADDDAGLVASVAVWMLPDSRVPTSVQQELAVSQSELEGTRHQASVAAEALVAALRPTTPHYYLGVVGTRSDQQRRGLATRVLAPILGRAETEGAVAFLETSLAENVNLYSGLGFRVTDEIDVPGGGPHVWAMTKG